MSGFLSGLGGFAGGLVQGYHQGEESKRADAANKRAQEEHAHNMKEYADKDKQDADVAAAAKIGYAYDGPDYTPPPAAVPASGLTPDSAAPPPPQQQQQQQQQQGMPLSDRMQAISDQGLAPPPPHPAMIAPPPAAAAMTPPHPAALAPPSPAAAITPPPQGALPVPGQAPPAEEMVTVSDPMTGHQRSVPKSAARPITDVERARNMAAAYTANGHPELGYQMIASALETTIKSHNFDQALAVEKLDRASLNPQTYAAAVESTLKQTGVPLHMIYDGNGVPMFNVPGTDAPPFYLTPMGEHTSDPRQAANFRQTAQVIRSLVGGDLVRGLTDFVNLQAGVQAIGINAQRAGDEHVAAKDAHGTVPLTREAIRANIRSADAGTAGTVIDNQTRGQRNRAELTNLGVSGRAAASDAGIDYPGDGAGGIPTSGFAGSSPVVGGSRITGRYGDRRSDEVHNGVDFAAPYGSKVVTPVGGTYNVVRSGGLNGASYVQVKQDDGSVVNFVHVQGDPSMNGKRVEAGTQVGSIAHLGRMTGANAHVTYLDAKGQHQDPSVLFGQGNQAPPPAQASAIPMGAHPGMSRAAFSSGQTEVSDAVKESRTAALQAGDPGSPEFQATYQKMLNFNMGNLSAYGKAVLALSGRARVVGAGMNAPPAPGKNFANPHPLRVPPKAKSDGGFLSGLTGGFVGRQ